MEFTATANKEFNSTEIIFNEKPSEAIREILKAHNFRWHKVKKLWYGYTPADEITKALNGGNITATTTKKTLTLWERCNPESIKEQPKNQLTKEIAKQLRTALKARFPEVKMSITSDFNSIDCTILSSPYAYDKGDYNNPPKLSPELEAVQNYCKLYANSFNYDNSDYYTDYSDVGFYGGYFEISYKYQQTEQTAEILKDCEDFKKQKAIKEEADKIRQQQEYERAKIEEEKQRIEHERKEQEAKKIIAEIEQTAEIIDLETAEMFLQLPYGMGKENSKKELLETYTEHGYHNSDTKVTRKVIINSKYREFIYNNFLRSFTFLDKMGGTATEDTRVTNDNVYKLSSRQREDVKFYTNNAVAIYFDKVTATPDLIIDPQGYDYARYVAIPADGTTPQDFTAYQTELINQSKDKEPFYFPKPITEQMETADLKTGDKITAYSIDDMLEICSYYAGTITRVKGKVVYYIPNGKRKESYLLINNRTIVYKDTLPDVPDSLKYQDIKNSSLRYTLFAGSKASSYLYSVINYFKALNKTPVIDTLQR